MARFMQMGTTDFWFTTVNTTPATPKAADLNGAGGQEITSQLAELTGFSFDNTPIDTPDMSTALVTKIPGEDSIADCSLTFYEDKTTNPIKTKLVKGTLGWVVICATGYQAGAAGGIPTSGDVVDVWPVQVSSNSRQYAAGAAASKYLVKLAPTGAPFIAVTMTV